jgi:hypothetical protein
MQLIATRGLVVIVGSTSMLSTLPQTYNNDPTLATAWATTDNKAKRPIIEFYPNLRLFDSGVLGKDPIDYVDDKNNGCIYTLVAGQESYYPDVAGYSLLTMRQLILLIGPIT